MNKVIFVFIIIIIIIIIIIMTFESSWSSTIKVGPLLKPTDMPNCCDVYGSDIYRTGLAKVGGRLVIYQHTAEKLAKYSQTATIFSSVFTQNLL